MEIGKNIKHPIFWISCFLFILHQIIQKIFGVHLPYIHSYLDDVVVMPIILTLILAERKKIFKAGEAFSFSSIETIGLVLFFSAIFEFIFPYFSDKFTFDWWDFLAYGFGGVIYYKWLN